MLRTTAKLLAVLNSETDPRQISLGFSLAMIAGLTPLFSLHNLLVLFLVLVLRVNLSAFLLGLALFSGLAYALDPIFHRLGLAVLTMPALQDLWTALYNSTVWRLERFNNSIVMGSLLASLALFVPLYLVAIRLILAYRARLLAAVRRSRLMQALTATRFYQMYRSASEWGAGW